MRFWKTKDKHDNVGQSLNRPVTAADFHQLEETTYSDLYNYKLRHRLRIVAFRNETVDSATKRVADAPSWHSEIHQNRLVTSSGDWKTTFLRLVDSNIVSISEDITKDKLDYPPAIGRSALEDQYYELDEEMVRRVHSIFSIASMKNVAELQPAMKELADLPHYVVAQAFQDLRSQLNSRSRQSSTDQMLRFLGDILLFRQNIAQSVCQSAHDGLREEFPHGCPDHRTSECLSFRRPCSDHAEATEFYLYCSCGVNGNDNPWIITFNPTDKGGGRTCWTEFRHRGSSPREIHNCASCHTVRSMYTVSGKDYESEGCKFCGKSNLHFTD